PLARGVGGDVGRGRHGVDGADVDDGPAADQERVRELHAEEHRPYVGGHHGVPLLHGGLDYGLAHLYGGVVHQGVDVAHRLADDLVHLLQGLDFGDIGHDELVHARLGPLGPLAVHAHHVPAVLGEHV